MESLIASLLTGAVGGNIAGALMKEKSLGVLGNSIAGIVGGGLGGQLLSMIGLGGDGLLGSIAGGGVGGALVMVIVSFISQAMKKGS
jgi:uncharacterized membrane protein YeaQ/YmgE (transglycosylase-associated protein family)